jgi:hypothetical protein
VPKTTDCVVAWAVQHSKETEPFFIAVKEKKYWFEGEYVTEKGTTFHHTADGILTWNGISEYGHDAKYG